MRRPPKKLFITVGLCLIVFIVGAETYRNYALKRTISAGVQSAITGKQGENVSDESKLVAIVFEHFKGEYQELVDTDKKLQGYELLSPATFKDRSHMMVIVNDIEHYIEVRERGNQERDQIAERLKTKLYASNIDKTTVDAFWDSFILEWNGATLINNQKVLSDTTISFMKNISEQYEFLIENYRQYVLSKSDDVIFKTTALQDEYRALTDKVSASAAEYIEVEASMSKKLRSSTLLPVNTLEEYFYR